MGRAVMAYTLPLLISLSVAGAFSADSVVLRGSQQQRFAAPALRKRILVADASARSSSPSMMASIITNTNIFLARTWGGKYGPDNILGIPSLVPCLIFFTVFAVWLTGVLATMQGAWVGAFKLIWAGAIAGVISRTAPPQPAQTSDPALPPLRRPLCPGRPGGSSCVGCSRMRQRAAVISPRPPTSGSAA